MQLVEFATDGMSAEEFADYEETNFELLRDAARWFHQYLVIIEIPLHVVRTTAITVNLQYLDPLPPQRIPFRRKALADPVAPEVEDPALDKISRWIENLFLASKFAVAGSYSFTVRVPIRAMLGCAHSTHISMMAPSGMRSVESVSMIDYGSDGPRHRVVYPSDVLLSEQAHIYVPLENRRIHHAEFRTSLYAYKSGFPIQAMVLSWLLVSLSSVTYWRAQRFRFGSEFLTSLEQNAAVFLLVIVPVVVAAVTQADGHRATSRSMQVPRFLMAIAVIAVLGTAGLIAFKATGPVAADGFRVAMIVTALVAIRLTISFAILWSRTTRRRATRERESAIEIMDVQLAELRLSAE